MTRFPRYRVLLKDKDLAGVSRGEKYISDNLKGKMKKKRMTKYAYDTTTSRVVGLTDESANWGKQFGKADMVIEAVFEDLSLKHKVIQQLEEHLPPHAVFASNTSAIPIARIAEASRRPENVIGMHYFSPVPQMPLLEIIPHKGTSNAAAAAAFEVGKKQGKTVIFVKDVPGFYVNRCLGPYLVETGALMEGALVASLGIGCLAWLLSPRLEI
jgi:enoyl-CoA hydratase/long-chain 3-hydroxyacyl-CoA dehydrogenase